VHEKSVKAESLHTFDEILYAYTIELYRRFITKIIANDVLLE
jgi:hypothetical protein